MKTNKVVEKSYPKITIVTPSLNQAHYIEQTILSVLNQNYPNLEYIIIDGGSTDGSVEIIKKYADKLAYWISEPDKGMYDAIQKGFDKSTGEIMAWLNSDDLYHPKAFFSVANIFQSFPNIKWLTGIAVSFDEVGSVIHVTDVPRWSKYRYYNTNEGYIQQESTFWNRELWDKIGAKINTNCRYAGDFDLWMRFFDYEKLYYIPTLIGGFRERSSIQLSKDSYSLYLAEARACRNQKWKTLTIIDKIKTKLINFDRITASIPRLRLYYYKSQLAQKVFSYPKELEFDRLQQKFVFK